MPLGTVTLPAESTAAQTLSVATRDDMLAGDEETFTVTLGGLSLPAGVSVETATARITADDALTVFGGGRRRDRGEGEGGDAAFTVSVTGGTSTAPVAATFRSCP